MSGAGGRGELALERIDLGPEDEPAAGHDPLDRGADIGRVLVQRHRQERHAQRRSHPLRRAPRLIHVAMKVLPVVRDRLAQAVGQRGRRFPASRALQLG